MEPGLPAPSRSVHANCGDLSAIPLYHHEIDRLHELGSIRSKFIVIQGPTSRHPVGSGMQAMPQRDQEPAPVRETNGSAVDDLLAHAALHVSTSVRLLGRSPSSTISLLRSSELDRSLCGVFALRRDRGSAPTMVFEQAAWWISIELGGYLVDARLGASFVLVAARSTRHTDSAGDIVTDLDG